MNNPPSPFLNPNSFNDPLANQSLPQHQNQFNNNLGGSPAANPANSLSPQRNPNPPIVENNNFGASRNSMPDLLMQKTNKYNFAMLGGDIVSLQQSQLFPSDERFDFESEIMKPLKAGGGLLGTTRIILEEKINLYNLDKSKTLTNDQMLKKLRIDGVYVDDPQIYQKFTDINVQKLEERILREKKFYDGIETTLKENGKTQYFKMNGEIKLHNDLLADEITRPADLAFESSDAYQTKEVNSILCNRLHSFKKRYYRLDIVIGKLSLLNYPQFFNGEDKIALELREVNKEYERMTSLAMIPFYLDRLRFMEQEQDRISRNHLIPEEDKDFLRQNIEETQRKLDQEKREVQELADQVYTKWKKIKEIRKTNQYASTNVKMKVHKNAETGELYFNLMHEEPSGKKFNGSALPSSEVSRRNNSMRIRAYCRLIINGKYVSRTKKGFLKWPNFEIEISEQFQVCVFTMPSSIQLELVVGTFKEQLVDVIDVEVPGKYVKALTSASQLVKEIAFSKFAFERKKITKKIQAQSKKAEGVLSEAQKKKLEIEQKKKEEEEKKAIDADIKGLLYIKAEWKGEGPEMPPMRSENIFKQKQPHKTRKEYTEEETRRMLFRQLYIDVNDPRNEKIIRFIKETKNEFLIKLLQEDAKNPLSHLRPFRHMLLEARNNDPDFSREVIPLLEKEIIMNPTLLDKLEVLFREQAYREYLEKKIEEERQGIKPIEQQQQVYILDYEDNAVKYDSECIRRRQIFFDKLKQYQREVRSGHQKASTQYKSIVREFELLESENPLLAVFNKIFISGRKLKPVVQKRQPVALDSCKQAKIMVHIIKGFNVPIRNSAKQDILQKFQGGGRFQNQVQDPYYRGMGGPTAISVNQLNQFGSYGRGGYPGSQQFDYRASFGQSQAMGMNDPALARTLGQNRMTNGIPLNAPQNLSMGGKDVGKDIRQLSEDQLRSLYTTARVETIVVVRIVYNEHHEVTKITNVAEGDFPEWNEILEFPLEALNKKKFTKHELINTKAMIYITLFDRDVQLSRNLQGPLELDQSLRYLGSLSIPLIALLNNPPKIEAILKLNRPISLFNYQVETNSFFFLKQQSDQTIVQKTEVPHTYISMSISLDPVLELPQDNEFEYYPGRESSALLIAATEWCKRLKKGKFEKRIIKAIGENVDGQSVLLCRYLTPQQPPLDIYDPKNNKHDLNAIEKAARFVSLIPYIEDNQAFNDMPDLICTSQEFLDLGAGDYEEHSILLCNFFNYIDQSQGRPKYRSYIALGISFPEGKTAYVMRRNIENNHVELWNPMKGEAFFFGREETQEKIGCISVSKGYKMDKKLTDAICQLKSIGTIIGNDNIWANVQEFEDPGLLNYNLNDGKFWKPFFTKSNFTKYFPQSIIRPEQSEQLQYIEPIKPEREEVIAIKIQSYITEMFEQERINNKEKHMRTKWNNDMESTLKEILFQCESRRLKERRKKQCQ